MTANEQQGDLSITALYTAQVWKWARFEASELFCTSHGRNIFKATNLTLDIARLLRPAMPSLRHSLAQRHAIIDALLAESGCTHVIELAAGLSRRGAAVTANPAFDYTEIDLPRVIDHKLTLLRRTTRGRAILARDNLHFLRSNIFDLELPSLVRNRPTCIIAEGLFMYLPADRQRDLWRRILTAISETPGSQLIFDLVPFSEQPRPGTVGRILERAFATATRGAAFAFDDRSRGDLEAELTEIGFITTDLFAPSTAPAHWSLPYLSKQTQTLVFRCTVAPGP